MQTYISSESLNIVDLVFFLFFLLLLIIIIITIVDASHCNTADVSVIAVVVSSKCPIDCQKLKCQPIDLLIQSHETFDKHFNRHVNQSFAAFFYAFVPSSILIPLYYACIQKYRSITNVKQKLMWPQQHQLWLGFCCEPG